MDIVFQFASLHDWLWMRGHGGYVWACYTITFAGIGGLLAYAGVQKRQFFKVQRAIQQRGKRA